MEWCMKKSKLLAGDWVALRLYYLMAATDTSWANHPEVHRAMRRYEGREKELDAIHREYQQSGLIRDQSSVRPIRESKCL